MVSVFKENKGAYCCLSVESQTFQNHVHFICNSHTTTAAELYRLQTYFVRVKITNDNDHTLLHCDLCEQYAGLATHVVLGSHVVCHCEHGQYWCIIPLILLTGFLLLHSALALHCPS